MARPLSPWKQKRRPSPEPRKDGGQPGVLNTCRARRALVAKPHVMSHPPKFGGPPHALPWLIRRRRFLLSWHCTVSMDSDHTFDSTSNARFASQGHAARPSTCAKGPSVSVSTRSRGIFAVSARPLLPANMAGPTLNQQPISTARASSLCVPENQCMIAMPARGSIARASRTWVAARRL